MEEIRNCDFSILLISESYLKSKNCMKEVLHVLKDKNYEEKILPIIIDSPSIYSTQGRIKYTQYWQKEKNEINELLSTLPATAIVKEIEELKIIENIASNINDFLVYMSDINNIKFEKLKEEGYKSIIESLGGVDLSHLVSLLTISLMKDLNKKELLLDKWFEENTVISEAYAIRASIAKENDNIEKANYNYDKALELDENNFYALNNYGFMLSSINGQSTKAKHLLEKAIEISPTFTIARLNLGVLLSNQFKDDKGARIQYEKIISYEPTEARAYNNLTNYYKSKKNQSKYYDKVCQLYEKAIKLNPDYIDARIGYGSYLSENMGEHDYAIEQYNEMFRIDKNSYKLVESLKQRVEKIREERKKIMSRNDKCFCGSDKKYKKCHGKN
jgi:Tfp pilus assembly protein PilF